MGEVNFKVDDANAAIGRVLRKYSLKALSKDETARVSLAFEEWRFNLRSSNNEPLVKLNVDGIEGGAAGIEEEVTKIGDLPGCISL